MTALLIYLMICGIAFPITLIIELKHYKELCKYRSLPWETQEFAVEFDEFMKEGRSKSNADNT